MEKLTWQTVMNRAEADIFAKEFENRYSAQVAVQSMGSDAILRSPGACDVITANADTMELLDLEGRPIYWHRLVLAWNAWQKPELKTLNWIDLLSPEYKGQISTRIPALRTISKHFREIAGEELAAQYMTALQNQGLLEAENFRNQARDLDLGKSAIAIALEYSVKKVASSCVKYTPTDVLVPTLIADVTKTPQARLFLKFVFSQEGKIVFKNLGYNIEAP